MAKKKLNKKVAIIGSMVFVLLGLIAIGTILYLSRDPEKFIKDGDMALEAARQATDEELKEQEYKNVVRNYLKARGLAKDDELRVEMLFKLVDVHIETEHWNSVRGCWSAIVKIDPENIKARLGLLEYIYIMADTGVAQFWQEVASQASELIDVVEGKELLMEETVKWATFTEQEEELNISTRKHIGPYLYLLRGRATLEMTVLGGLTDPDEALARAVEDLKKVQELEPNKIDAYLYLAQAIIAKGDLLALRGNLEEKDKAAEQAQELLKKAVEIDNENPKAHIIFLVTKTELAQMEAKEKVKAFESEYLALVDKFSSSDDVYLVLASFYQRSPDALDKAVKAAEKALQLNEESVIAALTAANFHYRLFSIYGQTQSLHRAIEIAKSALELPNAQDKPGPRNYTNVKNRTILYVFLTNCYIEQIVELVEEKTDSEKKELIANAEQTVHAIEQLYGSGEKPEVVKWKGMLELAKGNRNSAIRKMYAAYEQLKASGKEDAQLSYMLANVFKDADEIGAIEEFLRSALNSGITRTKPEAVLDYAEVLLRLYVWTVALSGIDAYEREMGSNRRSTMLRIRAYTGANQFEDAEKELANLDQNDPNTLKLNLALVRGKIRQIRRSTSRKQMTEEMKGLGFEDQINVISQADTGVIAIELSGYRYTAAELVKKQLATDPNIVNVQDIVFIFNSSIADGKIERAENIINQYLQYFPDNITALYYKEAISEPDPADIPEQRRNEIQKQVFLSLDNPTRKHASLGTLYQANNEPNKAIEEFKKALEMEFSEEGVVVKSIFDKTEEIKDFYVPTISNFFEVVLNTKDWNLAQQIVDIVRNKNIDDCEGNFYAARLAIAEKKYEDALARLDECLKQKPVFPRAYMLRSRVNSALGNEHSHIEDARKAASLNRRDGGIARVLAFALYQRNEKLGSNNVSSDQVIEARTALERAVALNQSDNELLSFYAEYISSTEPLRALAVRQTLQRGAPNMANAVLLGKLATKLAREEIDRGRKEALFDIAASAFEQAKQIDPHEKRMLYAYAEYYRARGQEEKARQLLQESEDKGVLWYHLYQSGQFEDAKKILGQLYQASPNDVEVLKGFMLVSEKLGDREGVKKYSEELLLLEESAINRLAQVRTFLGVGLIKEAELKLQSLREKYPDEPQALLLEAWLTMRQGKLKEALELTNKSLENEQNDPLAWRLRGEINALMSKYEQAVVDFKRSKSLSDAPVTRVALAKAYLRMGRNEDAITELKGAIDNPQGSMEARMLLEKIYTLFGRKDALISFYQDTVNKFPESTFWLNRAGAFVATAGEFDLAEQFYGRAWLKSKTDNQGDMDEAFDGYLQALLAKGKLDKVFEEAGKHVDGDFAALAFLGMAEAKLKLGDRATAVQYCRKAVEKAGRSVNLETWVLRRIHSLLGYQEVLAVCRERLEANPNSFAANFTMYNLAKIKNEYNKAITYIDKCLDTIDPNDPKRIDYVTQKVKVLLDAYNKTSDNNYRKKAIVEYESLLAKMPNNPDMLNNLAYLMSESADRLPEALEYIKRAYDIKPNDGGFLDTYAYVLYKQGKYSEAHEFINAALQNFEQYGTSVSWDIYEHLGLIKEKLGFNDEALTAYKRALEMGVGRLSESDGERIATAIERLSQ
ncbi:MAG: tetratricopeptide repeat protein [Planctomycetes bacterium]|nr:tetratricopeptide repeat protein [Planctomycetota bacterium]